MRTFGEHLERIRSQPHDVRRAFTLTTAGIIAGAIGLVWLGASLASGAFFVEGDGYAQAFGGASSNQPGNASGLAGAAAAQSGIRSVSSGTNMPPGTPASTAHAGAPANQSVISF